MKENFGFESKQDDSAYKLGRKLLYSWLISSALLSGSLDAKAQTGESKEKINSQFEKISHDGIEKGILKNSENAPLLFRGSADGFDLTIDYAEDDEGKVRDPRGSHIHFLKNAGTENISILKKPEQHVVLKYDYKSEQKRAGWETVSYSDFATQYQIILGETDPRTVAKKDLSPEEESEILAEIEYKIEQSNADSTAIENNTNNLLKQQKLLAEEQSQKEKLAAIMVERLEIQKKIFEELTTNSSLVRSDTLKTTKFSIESHDGGSFYRVKIPHGDKICAVTLSPKDEHNPLRFKWFNNKNALLAGEESNPFVEVEILKVLQQDLSQLK